MMIVRLDGCSHHCVLHSGRGSAAPALDVFITLLSLGGRGYKELCSQRKVTATAV